MTTPKLTATVVLAVFLLGGALLYLGRKSPQAQIAKAAPTVQASGLGAALGSTAANAQDKPPSLDDVLGQLGGVSPDTGKKNTDPHGWEALPTDTPLPKHTAFAAYSLEESKQIDYNKVQPGTLFYATMQRGNDTIISTGEGWFACGAISRLQGDEAKHWSRLQPEVQQEVSALCKPG